MAETLPKNMTKHFLPEALDRYFGEPNVLFSALAQH
jgi:hypothetical protein